MNPLFDENEDALKDLISKANAQGKTEYEDLEQLKQGSKAWFRARLGLFTGSKLPDLMTGGKGKEEWGLTALKVISRVIVERDLSDEGIELYVEELFSKNFRQTEWGNRYEHFAREEYRNITGLDVEETEFQRIESPGLMIGGSFDGKVINSELKRIVEIKCPYDILVHEENFQMLHSEIQKQKYYPQMQCNIAVANVDTCDFISFDPRRKTNRIKIITVPRNQEFIDKMFTRIAEAEGIISFVSKGFAIDDARLMVTKL